MATMPKKETVLKSVETMREEAMQRASAALDAAQRETAEIQDAIERTASKIERTAADMAGRASDVAGRLNGKLKSAGVDTDVMLDAAKGQANVLQQAIAKELRTRPMRALGVAAALGLVVGLLSAR